VFDHVGIRVADRSASREFYETVLSTLGHATRRVELFDEWGDFAISPATDEHPLTRRLHVAFVASSQADVDAFWRAGVEAGYPSDGEPGPRTEYHERYYGGFLLDPDGNSAEAVYHGRARAEGTNIDHLWMGVSDLQASRQFYATIAPVVGVQADDAEHGGRFSITGKDRSFTLLADRQPAQDVHIAFPAPDDGTVREFHRVALAAGYRDNGGPGKRPIYHPGYYGAFVLDPDGNNIEAVCHNR
jgi:catechol 2,3-dioxygenase-like lactoylglutathione lyase family enzyme